VALPVELRDGLSIGFRPSWNGPLFDAEAVRRGGLPKRDFFFWIEDTEYFFRLRRLGVRAIPVPEAHVSNRRPEARVPGERRTWRLYYEVRNTLVYRLLLKPLTPTGLWKALRVVAGKPVRILLTEPGKGASLKLWWWGVRDFALGRMGRRVDPATAAATPREPIVSAGTAAR
jgi:hypothetical protein